MSRSSEDSPRLVDILLVDDDPADVMLTRRCLQTSKLCNSLSVTNDGMEALQFLRRQNGFADAPRPDLILLDLNMPRMDGRELLQELKADEDLCQIPVVVLTTSDADQDVVKSYDLNATGYVTKPVQLAKFAEVVRSVNHFWLAIVKYPGG
ncbi:MAG: response regulator [Pirellulales bacterium]|nr:response regulator [Pirellulales bacterium]